MLDIPYKNGIPMIETIHNMYVFLDEGRWNVERNNESLFTAMIAVSKCVKEIYVRKNGTINPNKIDIVENAADSDRLLPKERRYVRELLGIDESSTVFICVSSFDSRKNQLGLMTAFDSFYNMVSKDSYLILVGNSLSEFYKDAVDEYMQELSSKSNILILPYQEDVASLLNASDAFVLPSYFEGWSIAATEALYCGTPLIHSNCGSGVEIVSEGENGILISNPAGDIGAITAEQLFRIMNDRNPQNTQELVSAMGKIHKDIEYWRTKRHNIASKSLLRFNRDKMVDGYIEVYQKILDKKNIM
jgi:Glycosyltransferase